MTKAILWWGLAGFLIVGSVYWSPNKAMKILWSVGAICAFVTAYITSVYPFNGE